MARHSFLAGLLLGAGTILASAAPFPEAADWDHHHHHHHEGHHSSSTRVTPAPTGTGLPTPYGNGSSNAVYPIGSGSGMPTSFATPIYTSSGGVSGFNPTNSVSSATSNSVVITTSLSNTVTVVTAAISGTATSAAGACTFTNAAEAISSKASCSTIILNAIAVPSGTTLDMTDLESGTTVVFEGTTTFGYKEWEGPLVSFSGTDITIRGKEGHLIDFNGAAWWDGQGSNGGITKPKAFYAHDLTDSVIQGLNVQNTPVQFMSIDGASNLQVIDVTMDNSAGDKDELGHNTDAFDIGSSNNVYISGANFHNQDDCLAINSGTDISFANGTCSGGHGLSIGSVGGRDNNTVENVSITDSSVSNSENGVRVKTVSGATGTVKNVTYSDITLSNISNYGIVIEQDYENGDPTGTPTNGVTISELTIKGVSGSVASGAVEVYILCGSDSCSDWTWNDVDVTGGKTSSDCENVPTGASC